MKIYDLSCRIYSGMPVFPGDREVTLRQYKSLTADGYNSYELMTGLHSGTHIDMPYHMLERGRKADSLPPERFFGPGVLLEAEGELEVSMKAEYEGLISRDVCVLIRTGFCIYGTAKEMADSACPVLSEELADALVRGGVKLVGVDFPSVDRDPYAVHKRLLSCGIFIVENLTGLEQLRGSGDFDFYALPLKIAAEASPVRAFAAVRGAEEQNN